MYMKAKTLMSLQRATFTSLLKPRLCGCIFSASFSSFIPTFQNATEKDDSKPKQKKATILERISAMVDRIHDKRLPPELRGRPNAILSETALVNIVERRIWQSMEEGQFENLPGKGKSLNLNTNPHADPAEDTLYRILSKNGFTPEWVSLNKEIREEITRWRRLLKKLRELSLTDCSVDWEYQSSKLQEHLQCINKKVFNYNLVAPFGKQFPTFKWERELQWIENPEA
eukprot:TRINITY_DN4749_c0_g1_i1.p1 TRINITY_DN4749_c0_g1~~TRINITY_DN4749_c0_g1_i1.p1  ORF type:complete len:228 (-),score=42.42 TRINITY_DN4749_c0_g1_i1:351-1034(-)